MVLGRRGWGAGDGAGAQPLAGLAEGASTLERGDADGQNVGAGEEQ